MTQAAASSSRNGGLFVPMPSREEAEELERVLAVEGVPIMDKYPTMGGVGHSESDLSDLSLIDDHALALAHDLITLGAGASAQSIMMGNEVTAVSNHLYMDNLSIPHQTIINPGMYFFFKLSLCTFNSTTCFFQLSIVCYLDAYATNC